MIHHEDDQLQVSYVKLEKELSLKAHELAIEAALKKIWLQAMSMQTSAELGRVLLNLFSNAFYTVNKKKHQAGNGFEPTIAVQTVKLGECVEIRIKDNGEGIPEKVLEKTYQPFFTTKPTGEGTGLGLSLSYDIITKGHGGDIKVEAREGEGSTFLLSLPGLHHQTS